MRDILLPCRIVRARAPACLRSTRHAHRCSRWLCWCSILTASSSPTTRWGIRWATGCSARWQRGWRLCCHPGDTVARPAATNSPSCCRRVIQHMPLTGGNAGAEVITEAPIIVDERPIDIGTSVGVAAYPQHADDADDLLLALPISRCMPPNAARGGIAVYDPHYEQYRSASHAAGELRRAIEQRVSCACSTSRSSPSRPTVSLALRRWCAGSTGTQVLPPSVHSVRRADRKHPHDHALGDRYGGRAMRRPGGWQGIELAVAINVSAARPAGS